MMLEPTIINVFNAMHCNTMYLYHFCDDDFSSDCIQMMIKQKKIRQN